ncbi:MAG: ribonuclease P protein component [Cyclobacteriaceae bacterium]
MGKVTDPQHSHKFGKHERLSSKKLIDLLFNDGQSMFSYPFTIKFLAQSDIDNHQVLISVPKKKFKRAVDRNLIKRRIKEAYRLNKAILADVKESSSYLLIAYIYTANEIHDFNFIESKLIKSLERLKSK